MTALLLEGLGSCLRSSTLQENTMTTKDKATQQKLSLLELAQEMSWTYPDSVDS